MEESKSLEHLINHRFDLDSRQKVILVKELT